MIMENENIEPVDSVATETAAPESDNTPVDVPAAEAAPASDKPVEGPKTMLEAMSAAMTPADKKEAPAPKPQDGVKPEEPKPGEPEDLTKMPEGLSAKAQERFQKLANENKQTKAEFEQMRSVIEPFQRTLQENGVTKEQFDMATTYIGLINKGDPESAYRLLEQELRELSLKLGKSVGGVDALANHADLRQAVDQFQITEQHALELARQRQTQQVQQQQRQQQERVQQSQRAAQEAHNSGLLAVDSFTKEMMKSDLDYARIEPILLEEIKNGLLEGIDPSKWKNLVQQTYNMIKRTAGQSKTVPTDNALRPVGGGSPSQQPKDMYAAMFPNG